MLQNIPPYNFTAAQLRAIQWLDEWGSWQIVSGGIGRSINSLSLASGPHVVEVEWGDFGSRGGRKQRARLTLAGMDIRRRIFLDLSRMAG